jgi:glycosyltransferase involved in cell wall biosynthesis
MNYTFIIPFYNEDQNITTLNDEIIKNIKKLSDEKRNFEIIYVDDGSTDKTFDVLKKLNTNNIDTTIIRHRINMSQSAALNTGISHSKYENLIILDGDLQNDPDDVNKMINEFEKGADMIIGWRKKRKDNFLLRSLPSIVANYVVRLFSKSKIHDHGCAFKIIKKNTIDELTNWGDFHRLLAARLANNGYNVREIEVNHKSRIYGKSNYGFSRILKVLIDLLYLKFFKNYRRQSIYFFGLFSFFSFLFSILCFIYMIVLKFIYNTSFIQTPLPLLIIFLLMVGLIFLFIGILAQLIMNQDKSSDKIKDSIVEKINLRSNK